MLEFCEIEGVDFLKFDFLFENFDTIRFNQSNIFSYILKECNEYSDERQELLFNLYTSISTSLNPYPGITDWINVCRNNNILIGVLTNGNINAQINKWNCLNFDKSDIFFQSARNFGHDKPESSTFDKFFQTSGFDLNQTIFVGDRFSNDLEYGYNAGSPCILIGSSEIKIPQFDNHKSAFLYFQSEFIDN
jgi:FMN phosphatase YigB (HAD superfamily)